MPTSNQFSGKEQIRQTKIAWQELADEIDKTVTALEEYNKTGGSTPSAYLNGLNKLKAVQDAYNDSVRNAISIQSEYTAELKEQKRISNAKLQYQAKLNQATGKEATELARLRFELQQTNKHTKDSSILQSRLATEYQKLEIKMNRAGRTVQNLTAKREAGTQLSNKEQKELKESTREFEKYQKAILKADESVGKFQRNVGNYKSAFKGGIGALRNLAGAFGLMGAGMIAKGVFDTIRDFDKRMIEVRKTTNMTGGEIKVFRDELLQLSRDTKGISLEALTDGSIVAGQLGIKGSANILKFTKTMAQLGVTSDIAGEESARAMAKFLAVTQTSVDEVDRIGASLTVMGNNYATTESEVLSMATEMARGSAMYGVTADQFISIATASASAGGQLESSASSLQRIFSKMNESVRTGKNVNVWLKATGLNLDEFKKKFAESPAEVFSDFVKGLKDIKDEGGNVSGMLKQLGLDNIRVEKFMGGMINTQEQFTQAMVDSEDAYKNNTALTEEYGIASESLDAKITDLSTAWDGLVLTFDSSEGNLTKFFMGIIGMLTNAIELIRLLNLEDKKYQKEREASMQKEGLEFGREALSGFGTNKRDLEGEAKLQRSIAREKIQSNEALIKINDQIIKQHEEEKKLLEEKGDFQYAYVNGIKTKVAVNTKLSEGAYKKIVEQTKEYKRDLAFNLGLLEATGEVLDDNVDKGGEANTLAIDGDPVEDKAKKKAEADAKREAERQKKALEKLQKDKWKIRQTAIQDEIKQEIKAQDKIIKNKERANWEIIEALKERANLQRELSEIQYAEELGLIELERQANSRSYAEGLVAQEIADAKSLEAKKKYFQDLIDLTNEANAKIKDTSGRDDRSDAEKERDAEEKDANDFDAITKDAVIKKMVELTGEAYQDLADMYEDDSAKFMEELTKKLKGAKLLEETLQGLSYVFDELGEMYGVDASKFTALFDDKKNTTGDFVDAGLEAFKGLYNAQAHNYDEDIRLARESAEIQMRFAGDNVKRKEDLQRQLAEKERKIRRKQAEDEKNQAIFNAIIGTAQGIAGALPNIPLAVAVGLIGAVQIALISSQPIPQFKDGVRDFSGGMAVVGDGGRSEVITTKDGGVYKTPSTDTLVNLPSGANVYKSESDFNREMNKMLNFNGVLREDRPNIPVIRVGSDGISTEAFKTGIDELSRIISSKESAFLSIDKNGFRTFTKKGDTKREKLSNRGNIKGRGI